MREFLYKLASWIVKHLTIKCVYDSKKRGDCLCKYCENSDCKIRKLESEMEAIKNDF